MIKTKKKNKFQPKELDISKNLPYGAFIIPNGKVILTESHYDVLEHYFGHKNKYNYIPAFKQKWVRIINPHKYDGLNIDFDKSITPQQFKTICKLAFLSETYNHYTYIENIDYELASERNVKNALLKYVKGTKPKTKKKKTYKNKTSKKKAKK